MPYKFKKKINGKIVEFKHYNRHKANARRVSSYKYLEHKKEKGIILTDSEVEAYNTGFNMGYEHGRKRYLNLEEKDSHKSEEVKHE